MKKTFVKRIDLYNLKNDLHFEFTGSMYDILARLGIEIPYIAELLQKFSALLKNEDEAIDQVRKSDATGQIQENDYLRDNTFYGIRESVRTAFRHSDPARREAAKRLDIVLEAFKKAPRLELPAESSAIHNLLQELELRRGDIDLLGLGEWIDDLRRFNDNVRSLMSQRNSEAAARTQFRMKEVKTEVNTVYNDILSKLESAAELEGEEKYAALFKEMNACVDEYLRIVARGKGGGKDDKGDQPEKE